MVDDHAREDDSEAAADAEHGRQEADPDLHLLGRELVPDDREAQREERASGARDDAECDQRPDVPGEGGAEATGEEQSKADQQHPLLAELVAELAEDGVVTAAETRNPVSTQVVHAVLAPNSS